MGRNAHLGFKAAARPIAKRQGISPERTVPERAAGTRRAGAAAPNTNSRLNRV